jgi:hypothetical protein
MRALALADIVLFLRVGLTPTNAVKAADTLRSSSVSRECSFFNCLTSRLLSLSLRGQLEHYSAAIAKRITFAGNTAVLGSAIEIARRVPDQTPGTLSVGAIFL